MVNNGDLPRLLPPTALCAPCPHTAQAASGEKAKARAILAAIRTLQAIEQAQRPATPEERAVLARFPGFGPVALGIFPDPVTGRYKDATWQTLGEELRTLLTPEDYASARRTTFTAFYTSPLVIRAMHEALGTPGRAPRCDRPGAGLRHREFHGPGPCGHALHRRGARQPLRAYRPRALPRP